MVPVEIIAAIVVVIILIIVLIIFLSCGSGGTRVITAPSGCTNIDPFVLGITSFLLTQTINGEISSKWRPSTIAPNPPTIQSLVFVPDRTYSCIDGRIVISTTVVIAMPNLTIPTFTIPVKLDTLQVEGSAEIILTKNPDGGYLVQSVVVAQTPRVTGTGPGSASGLIAILSILAPEITRNVNTYLTGATGALL